MALDTITLYHLTLNCTLRGVCPARYRIHSSAILRTYPLGISYVWVGQPGPDEYPFIEVNERPSISIEIG